MTLSTPNKLEKLHLKSNHELLGILKVCSIDFPWFICKFEPTRAFAKVKPLFDEELQLIDDTQKWEQVYNKLVEFELVLIDINNNHTISKFLLHIENNEAWFRY